MTRKKRTPKIEMMPLLDARHFPDEVDKELEQQDIYTHGDGVEIVTAEKEEHPVLWNWLLSVGLEPDKDGDITFLFSKT